MEKLSGKFVRCIIKNILKDIEKAQKTLHQLRTEKETFWRYLQAHL